MFAVVSSREGDLSSGTAGAVLKNIMGKENLERIFNQATTWDLETARHAWFRYQRLCGAMAEKHGFPMVTGAAVFAALSPNNEYSGNLRDVNTLLGAARAGLALDDFAVSTYRANKVKAWRIAHGEQPLDLIVANKTRNFFLSIMDPLDPKPCCVDGHIFNAWEGRRIPLNSWEMKRYSRIYGLVADAIRQMAAERNMITNVVQGVIWYCHKRIHHIKINGQREFWAADALAAGLGFERES